MPTAVSTQHIAEVVCDAVDWQRPELTNSPMHRAYQDGNVEAAALALIRHLRERSTPKMGYTAAYVEALRANATPEFTTSAREQIDRIVGVGFLGGSAPDGRGTLIGTRAELIQVGAREEHFKAFAQTIAESIDDWGRGNQHVSGGITRYLRIVWEMDTCTDEDLLPIFGFLVTQFHAEWSRVRHWNEAGLGTSGHNWWVAEFGWIWEPAFFFPEFKNFSKLQTLFPAFFEREMQLLVDTDGFTHERSVNYHTGTSDLFLGVVRLAKHNGLSISDAFIDRLRKMYDFEWKTVTPNGNQPAFGDCLAQPGYAFNRMRSIAALLGIGEAKFIAETMDAGRPSDFGDMWIETLHYPTVGEDLRATYEATSPSEPTDRDFAFPASQYYVMRHDWSRDSDYLAIEASAKGNLVTSHGHGCFFDIKLYSRGRHILVGNGKGPCGTTQIEETWRKESMSHSVAVVDGQNHLPLRSPYRYTGVVMPTVDGWLSKRGEYAYFSGAHEAYERLEEKVPCSRRKIFSVHGRYWILIDRFTAASPEHTHEYQQRFQVGVPSRIDRDQRVITQGEGGNLLFMPVAETCGIAASEPIPYPYLDHPEPDQVTFTKTADGSTIMIMLLVPFVDDQLPEAKASLIDVSIDGETVSPWEVTGLEIEIDGERDVFVAQHMQWSLSWQAAEHAGSDRLFHSCFGGWAMA